MKKKYIDHRFNKDALAMIDRLNTILAEYERQGYRLSLRQLYYQLVARDIIENSVRSYKRTGELVSTARLAGLIDWGMIEDRGRETQANTHWTSPGQIVEAAARGYRTDHWVGQPCYVEVMVEKDALSGILSPVCQELDIRFSANKGYSSSSAMYYAGRRLLRELTGNESVREIHLFYFGDHDPSGIDMTRDVTERLAMFAEMEPDQDFFVHRLALNYDQVEQWRPPENPAKESDSRYEDYAAKFGVSSWELDAVEPATLADLLRDNVRPLIDQDIWGQVVDRERAERAELLKFADQYKRDAGDESEEEEDGE